MQIVLTTFNARYSHTSLSLRCLRANLGALRDDSEILEFDNSLSPQAAAEKLIEKNPTLILFSIYIWNRVVTCETILILKKIRPDIKIIIGGPEVCYDHEESMTVQAADHLLTGEGEEVIEQTCRDLLDDNPLPKVIEGTPADLSHVALPYNEYTDDDIAHRRVYVESARGCPFSCAYCLSALESGIRTVPRERILPEFEKLIERGARIFKFIDRSFNAVPDHAAEIMNFFLDHRRDGMMLHLEWEPHLLPKQLEEILRDAPPGFFQLECGVQTFSRPVAERIHRRLDEERIEKNISRLCTMPSVHLHADLIAGLPGETMESLATGFDRLHACAPHEIQLGILKKLRGAPIAQYDRDFEMVYNTAPPYDVLQTSTLTFPELQAIRRFARFWDITVNNGRFPTAAPLIWRDHPSVFTAFMDWNSWLYRQTHAVHGFTPGRLGRLLEQFLVTQCNLPKKEVQQRIDDDLNRKTAISKGMERQTRRNNPASNSNKTPANRA